MKSSSPNWPLKGQKLQRAFEPGQSPSAVPLLDSDKLLDWDDYLDRMSARLKWLREKSQLDDPNGWYSRQWFEKAGRDVDPKNLEDHVLTPEFEELLNSLDVSRDSFPQPALPSPQAKDSVLELDLVGWLEEALPSHEW